MCAALIRKQLQSAEGKVLLPIFVIKGRTEHLFRAEVFIRSGGCIASVRDHCDRAL